MNVTVCPQLVQQPLILKHTDVYSQGVWLNSAKISMKALYPHLHCLLHWPVINTFLKDSHGHFFQILLNEEMKEKAEEGNLKDL